MISLSGFLVLFLLAGVSALATDYSLYTAMATTKGYVVGSKLLPSGVFKKTSAGEWRQVGFSHPFVFSLDFDPRDPSRVYVAAGNGLLRVDPGERTWTITTSQDITEARDVSVDNSGAIYFGHSAGIRVSNDGGASWQELAGGLKRKYTETIRADRAHKGVVIAGTEEGLFRTGDAGSTWRLAGAAGFQIIHISQSPHDACHWIATTQGGGLFVSKDCGKTFENSGELGVDRNLYDVAFDPASVNRIAVCGWGPGVAVSDDGGKTWQLRNSGLPRPDVWSVAFDPAKSGRLYASVHEEALYVSEDTGLTWRKVGLEGSIIYRMKFVPEVPR